jgi:hypothetical protein
MVIMWGFTLAGLTISHEISVKIQIHDDWWMLVEYIQHFFIIICCFGARKVATQCHTFQI